MSFASKPVHCRNCRCPPRRRSRARFLSERQGVMNAHSKQASEHHPDKGGTDAKMAELNEARDNTLKEVGNG